MHLTNYAINKNSTDFVRDDEAGSKRWPINKQTTKSSLSHVSSLSEMFSGAYLQFASGSTNTATTCRSYGKTSTMSSSKHSFPLRRCYVIITVHVFPTTCAVRPASRSSALIYFSTNDSSRSFWRQAKRLIPVHYFLHKLSFMAKCEWACCYSLVFD